MKARLFWKKHENALLMILTVLVNIILAAVFFDFYYSLNDDVLMKDIMAGAYTGTPDGHTMQTLYLLGALISLLYRLFRGLPWYGLFLCLCQFGCLYLAGHRLLSFCGKLGTKIAVLVLATLFTWGIWLPHMTAVQYTVTCGMLVATAIFLFVTTPAGLSAGRFIWKNIPAVLLVVLAYQLRTEMTLLLCPFICLAGLFRWLCEEHFFQTKNFIRYGGVVLCLAVGMFALQLPDMVAYGSAEWSDFRQFFDDRTQVYDYHYDVLTSGDYAEALSSMGISDAQQTLLSNYNFGLDDDIDSALMSELSAYTKTLEKSPSAFLKDMPYQCRQLVWKLLHGQEAPFGILLVLGYLGALILGTGAYVGSIRQNKRREQRHYGPAFRPFAELCLLLVVRTALWLYIMERGRIPERITHSLYLAELAVLLGMIVVFVQKIRACDKHFPQRILLAGTFVWAGLLGLICLYKLPETVQATSADEQERVEANTSALAIDAYCKAHPENFYFEDVYATVSFSEKMFASVDNELTNYDILGGWICKSPLYEEKLAQFGIESASESLVYDTRVMFIAKTGEDLSWMKNYYAGQGVSVRINAVDAIDADYAVYQVALAE